MTGGPVPPPGSRRSRGVWRGRERPPGVGIVGLGFMGRVHLEAFAAARRAGLDNRLVAVCDSDPARRAGRVGTGGNLARGSGGEPAFDVAEVAAFDDPAGLIACPDVDVVSIATPTETHVPLACAALEAGKHVLVEKPLALRATEAQRLAAAAERAAARGVLCLPAMCMRFWPGWRWLKEAVDDGRHGRVVSATFRRLSARPDWAPDFYGDVARTGGALFDLHVHDADFVRFCFGPPAAVCATGGLDHLTTAYVFDDGPRHVVAEGGWDHSPGFPFHMGFTVVFEDATADYAFGREPVLRLSRGGAVRAVEVGDGTGYDGEVRHLLGAVAREGALDASVGEAVGLVAMLEAERESLRRGAPVRL